MFIVLGLSILGTAYVYLFLSNLNAVIYNGLYEKYGSSENSSPNRKQDLHNSLFMYQRTKTRHRSNSRPIMRKFKCERSFDLVLLQSVQGDLVRYLSIKKMLNRYFYMLVANTCLMVMFVYSSVLGLSFVSLGLWTYLFTSSYTMIQQSLELLVD